MMNRKAFIAAFFAFLMPWKKAPKPITVKLTIDDAKFQEMIWRAKAEVLSARMKTFRNKELRKMAEDMAGADWQVINDSSRPHHLGCFIREVEA